VFEDFGAERENPASDTGGTYSGSVHLDDVTGGRGSNRFVYLDHNATTPVDPRVLDAMLPFFEGDFGNPSSQHPFGGRAADAVRVARQQVAALLHAAPSEITFTSGATESIGAVLRATTIDCLESPGHLAVGSTEHPAVLDTARYLASKGCVVDYVGVDGDGVLLTEELEKSVANGAHIVSVMAANNETGVISPLAAVHSICTTHGALFHCDATQIFGKLLFSVDDAGVDFASMSAHKLYGPKGVGALFIRRDTRGDFSPLLYGGGQEQGLRSGTPNVPGIVGFGAAAALALAELDGEGRRLAELRDLLLSLLRTLPVRVSVNGGDAAKLPGTLNVAFEGIDAEALLARLLDIALSTGSACASGVPGPSPVLLAMGQDEDRASSAVRFSLGRFTTADDISYAVGRIRAETAALIELGA
jgi:cysteine desulfurase